jgi:hypothetical protein
LKSTVDQLVEKHNGGARVNGGFNPPEASRPKLKGGGGEERREEEEERREEEEEGKEEVRSHDGRNLGTTITGSCRQQCDFLDGHTNKRPLEH